MSDRPETLSPEAIAYVREWAASGNEPRPWWRIKEYARGIVEMVGTVGSSLDDDLHQLDSLGLTISAQVDEIDSLRAGLRQCIQALELPGAEALRDSAIAESLALLGDSND